jgi:hypothetical protein
VLLGALWAALATTAACLGRYLDHHAVLCPFRLITGLPCPFCGSGRAVASLLWGEVLEGWLWNPLMVTAFAAFAAVLGARLLFGRAVVLGLSRRERAGAWAAAGAAILLNWAYVIGRLNGW